MRAGSGAGGGADRSSTRALPGPITLVLPQLAESGYLKALAFRLTDEASPRRLRFLLSHRAARDSARRGADGPLHAALVRSHPRRTWARPRASSAPGPRRRAGRDRAGPRGFPRATVSRAARDRGADAPARCERHPCARHRRRRRGRRHPHFNAADFPRHVLAEEHLARRDPDGFLWDLLVHITRTWSAAAIAPRPAEAEAGSGQPQTAAVPAQAGQAAKAGKAMTPAWTVSAFSWTKITPRCRRLVRHWSVDQSATGVETPMPTRCRFRSFPGKASAPRAPRWRGCALRSRGGSSARRERPPPPIRYSAPSLRNSDFLRPGPDPGLDQQREAYASASCSSPRDRCAASARVIDWAMNTPKARDQPRQLRSRGSSSPHSAREIDHPPPRMPQRHVAQLMRNHAGHLFRADRAAGTSARSRASRRSGRPGRPGPLTGATSNTCTLICGRSSAAAIRSRQPGDAGFVQGGATARPASSASPDREAAT